MKKIIYLIAMLFLSVGAFSQVPQLISYQAVVRNSNNVLVTNSNVSVSISIVKDSANGTVVYSELHSTTTNANGLFSFSIGTGLYASGSLSSINWASGVYFIKSQIDPNGGLNFTITGTSQILSVPYALYAANGTKPGSNVGDLQYWDGTKWAILPAGANGTTLTMSNGVPTWGTGSVTATLPSLTTTTPSSITSNSALCGGNVTSAGSSSVTSYGICYATTSNPTTSNNTVQVGSGTGTFSTTVSGLSTNTTYYIRAYATSSVGTSYGNQVSITTNNLISSAPTVTTTAPISINITASQIISGGNITSIGSSAVTSYGLCYATTSNPTVANSTVLATGSGTGSFLDTISNLNAGTIYYVRAFATNSAGTSYGNQLVVTTETEVGNEPTVLTINATASANGTVTLTGAVTDNGGDLIQGVGGLWDVNPIPAYRSPYMTASLVDGNFLNASTDTFSTSITNLTPGTTYYFRAFASNGWSSTAYGNQITYTVPSNTATYKIGQSYGGGTIFYVDGSGQHGLIVANSDAGGITPWYNGSYITTGTTDTTVGAGAANTSSIISTQGTGSYAAYLASQTANGYSDWYLPSKGELDLIFINLTQAGLGNMQGNVYWSSSEYDVHQAWAQQFVQKNYINTYTYYKSNSAFVRPIRKF